MSTVAAEPTTPAVARGNVVRIVRAFGPGQSIALLGTVLGVAPITPETVGANGEPAITAVYLKPDASPSLLGSFNWHQAFERVAGILHHSNPDVVAGRHGIYWVDSVDHVEAAAALPEGLPVIEGGESTVFSRETADAAMDRPAKVVPAKVEPVTEARLQAAVAQHPSAADLDAAAAEQAAREATGILAGTTPPADAPHINISVDKIPGTVSEHGTAEHPAVTAEGHDASVVIPEANNGSPVA